MKASKRSAFNDEIARALLAKYDCPVPYHEVRPRFLGNIATPDTAASPLTTLQGLWGGTIAAFEDMEAVNEILNTLINGLWNSLTRHQIPTEPFRLTRPHIESTIAGLGALALIRQQEIDGFVEGLFNGADEIALPKRASRALDVLAEARAMMAGVHALVCDPSIPGSNIELISTSENVQQMTAIVEREIHAIVLDCTKARRDMLRPAERKLN